MKKYPPTRQKTRNHDRSPDQAQLNLAVPAILKTEIMRLAKAEDMTASQLVRKILREKGREYGINPEEPNS